MKKVAIISAPYEQTTSYGKGAKYGPGAIISALNYVEDYDIEENKSIDRASIKILPALKNINTYRKLSEKIDKVTKEVFSSGSLPIYLGGEHTITAAIIPAIKKYSPDFTVLHLDAHSDLRDTYGNKKYSHACVARRIYETGIPIVSVGMRSQSYQESEFIANLGTDSRSPINIFYAHEIHKDRNWIQKVVDSLGKKIYISFDVDVIDPAYIRATGTPEPGGLTWEQATDLFKAIKTADKNLIGMDITELAPVKGDHASDFFCAKIICKILALFIS